MRGVIARAAFVMAAASLAYTLVAIERTAAFGRRRRRARGDGGAVPSVSIVKPLHGVERQLAANLRSFCAQDYPAFDVILGAREADDAALAVAHAVAAEDPVRVRVAHADAGTPHYANPKVDTLAALVPHARGDVLVFADSDMYVAPDYLRAIVADMRDPQVGAVTCLYRGRAADASLASRLGALANHEAFAPSALIAAALMGMRFGFGATIAVRRSVFDEIGGLAAIGGNLADDATLCALVAARGYRVVLATYVVENVVHEPTFAALWHHELRWARTHRALQPAGFVGLFLTYPIALALAAWSIAPRRRGFALLVVAALALRCTLSRVARDAFGAAPESWWLLPLRDAFGLAVWTAAFGARSVRWADAELAIDASGSLLA